MKVKVNIVFALTLVIVIQCNKLTSTASAKYKYAPRLTKIGFDLYCPQGTKFSTPSVHYDQAFQQAFGDQCQCDCCPYGDNGHGPSWNNVGCSGGVLGQALEEFYNGKVACVLHDFCYSTQNRTRLDCDLEFKENLLKVCQPKLIIGQFQIKCSDIANDAFNLVRIFGEPHFQPFKNCPNKCSCRPYYSEFRMD